MHPDTIKDVQEDIDLDGDTLVAKIQVNVELITTLHLPNKGNQRLNKQNETIINGIDIGNKFITGQIMEGKVLDDYLVVNVSKTSNEEIAIDGSIVVYRENDAFEVGIVWSKKKHLICCRRSQAIMD